ncbi:MAG: glycosyl transferase family 2, partial [Synergistaceae bacterium]|nr:glycosyl transferase family 2 [Synergistaceae bacterium]
PPPPPPYNLQEVLVYMRVSKDFYRRRGGIKLTLSSLKLKYGFLRSGFISITDFLISGFGQAAVTLMPGFMREWFYKKFLRS